MTSTQAPTHYIYQTFTYISLFVLIAVMTQIFIPMQGLGFVLFIVAYVIYFYWQGYFKDIKAFSVTMILPFMLLAFTDIGSAVGYIAILLVFAFVLYLHYQQKRHAPVLPSLSDLSAIKSAEQLPAIKIQGKRYDLLTVIVILFYVPSLWLGLYWIMGELSNIILQKSNLDLGIILLSMLPLGFAVLCVLAGKNLVENNTAKVTSVSLTLTADKLIIQDEQGIQEITWHNIYDIHFRNLHNHKSRYLVINFYQGSHNPNNQQEYQFYLDPLPYDGKNITELVQQYFYKVQGREVATIL
ncbi:hypothetical protein [Psychrobacter sp. I-STPA10]|uniref:hypothetical protein n=1 Tax=Psychrobacter sp. I-STPA10 TaxID=2585769 RepID=UPI001E625437|nr:hypothetical protein [Psychrobacter sp. I-STPA10]